MTDVKGDLYDLIATIRDPERPGKLSQITVLGGFVQRIWHEAYFLTLFSDKNWSSETLEELDIVREEWVEVSELGEDYYDLMIWYKPTVTHWWRVIHGFLEC